MVFFANAIGIPRDELHFLHELHPNFSTSPTFSCNLAFKRKEKRTRTFMISSKEASEAPVPGIPPLDPQRSVDGERGIEIINPIPTSSEDFDLEIHPEIVGVHEKGRSI
ncbi:hypothetical protein MAP00_004601 [Monascus purpureus]|nr:hypothetical protein MAP00_004601 [Monascus purpureus]